MNKGTEEFSLTYVLDENNTGRWDVEFKAGSKTTVVGMMSAIDLLLRKMRSATVNHTIRSAEDISHVNAAEIFI